MFHGYIFALCGKRFSITLMMLVFCVALRNSRAQEPEQKSPSASANIPEIKQIADGVVQVGGVTLDKHSGSVTFSGTLNLDRGEMEYLLVQEGGKSHESLLVTTIQPTHLHVAMLLLGAKVPKQTATEPPPDAINIAYLKTAPRPQGSPVNILVRWKDASGQPVEVHAEDLMFNDEAKAPMTRGPWIYNGSMMYKGTFLAQQERSIVALVLDPTALINNTRPGCDNDEIWSVRTDKTPKAGTPVEICIRLAESGTASAPSQQ